MKTTHVTYRKKPRVIRLQDPHNADRKPRSQEPLIRRRRTKEDHSFIRE